MSAVVGLPKVSVRIDDMPLSPAHARALAGVLVQKRLSLPTLCELRFLDPANLGGASDTIRVGAMLKVLLEGHPEPLFVGQITGLEFGYGPSRGREVRVRGYDLLHQLRKRQPMRVHVDVSAVSLARELVEAVDLEVICEWEGPRWKKVMQHGQSDLALLTEVAQRSGLYFIAQPNRLHLFPLSGAGPSHRLELGRNLLEVRIDVNSNPACRNVTTLGWDPWHVQVRSGRAEQARMGRQVALGVSPAAVGGSGARTLVDRVVETDEQAAAAAQGELDRRVAGEVVCWGVADGDPALAPGHGVELYGVAAGLSGRYVLTSVTHSVDRERGYLCEFDSAPPSPRQLARPSGSTWGRVTQLSDPEGLGRVCVALPSYGDLETDWLEVVTPGAGSDKGLVSLPDIGDQVLVLFVGGDPNQAVVLGGLYGEAGPPDAGIEDEAVRRYTWVTPQGQQIQLDDGKRTVQLKNSSGHSVQLAPSRVRLRDCHGSYIELTQKKLLIHSETDLEIEAPGQAVKISAESIDFERR